jgi:hypothetical protein
MTTHFFVIKAPPINFSNNELYNADFSFGEASQAIKAISDTFFLSNEFRQTHTLYFLTEYLSKSYIITFEGTKIRYLGPSSYSSTHLLLRAIRNIIDPFSKKGKLTPGIKVKQASIRWIQAKHEKDYLIRVIKSPKIDRPSFNFSLNFSIVWFFGYTKSKSESMMFTDTISWGLYDIDEQVILTNHFIDGVN